MTRSSDDSKKPGSELTYKMRGLASILGSTGVVLHVAGEGLFQAHTLPPGQTLIIGRSTQADLCVEHATISRQHARIYTGPPLSIEDLGSSNGTRLGARRLDPGEIVEVSVGEAIMLGSVLIVVAPGSESSAAKAAAPGAAPEAAPPDVVIRAPAMRELYALVDRVAPSAISVLLLGETGAGKEVMAEAIHRRSPRASKPFLRLNCGALSETLLESELFGHERGAFTGAQQTKTGLLESADGGTVFLDEVGELPLSLQVKLLRVLEERQVMRVGGLKPRPIDVRFVSATNRDLEVEVERGTFRRDLYFRLNGIALTIPPLRERLEEIEGLSLSFLARMSQRLGRPTPRLSPEALAHLRAHTWPGNIRELRNAVERAAVLCVGDTITAKHLLIERAGGIPAPPPPRPSMGSETLISAPARDDFGADNAPVTERGADLRSDLEAVERRRIVEALERCAGNQTQAARMLGISRGTLLTRLQLYGLPRPRTRKP